MITLSLQELAQEAQTQTELREYRDREEAGDAELFASMFRDRVVYDRAAKAWYVWRGQYWERDRIGEVCKLVKDRLAGEYMGAAAEATKAGNKDEAKAYTDRARLLWKRRRIEDVLWHAGQELALTGEEWDSNPLVLGVNNGVLDLATGTCRDGGPGEYLRVHAPVDWLALDYPAPMWEDFILSIFDGDVELAAFMQRLLGYCLTGVTTEHLLPILYGEGRNGKSTLLETLRYVLGGDLSHATQADALMDVKRDGAGAQPFVYALRGRRMVWATESKEGQRINEGLIKQLTGGDSITTRTLFSDVITFKPTHKVMLLTNHKPHINAESQAMWDRVILIPFNLRFVDEPSKSREYKRNPRLSQELQDEAPGILGWLVRGCLAWQRDGLNPPASVKAATEEYRSDEDTIGEFIADCLTVETGQQAQADDIYRRYQEWAKSNGIEAMSKIALGKRLARRFGASTRNAQGKVYSGVGVTM